MGCSPVTDFKSLEDAFIDNFKWMLQAALEAEMDSELGYSKYNWRDKEIDNSRNGHSKKTVQSRMGKIPLDVPRDLKGEFEPVIVKKHERTVNPSIEDTIFSLYARGMSTNDISLHLNHIYKLDSSAEMISRITGKILPVAREWQNRLLQPMYPIIYLDGIVFNVQQDGHVIKKTTYIIYGITIEGKKDVLGIWIGENESSKFWMKVLVDLKNRGVQDILITAVDGLKGFEEAITSVFPKTEIQQCIIRQIRTSTKFVSYKERKEFCQDMKKIYTSPNEEAGLQELNNFEQKWGQKYGYAVKSWKNNWPRLSTFFKYPEEIRRLIYTTNPIENLNRQVRKITKTKSSFPTDDSLLKILYLIIMDVSEKWTIAIDNWPQIVQQLSIYFGPRMEVHLN